MKGIGQRQTVKESGALTAAAMHTLLKRPVELSNEKLTWSGAEEVS